jgi:serine/threonine-protein kinase
MKKAVILILVFIFGFSIGFIFLGFFGGTILRKPAQDIKMPNVVGFSISKAESIINATKLKIKNVVFTYDTLVPAGYILSQKPPPGQFVKSGRKVILVVSKGAPRQRIPPIENIALDKYLQMIYHLGFRVVDIESLHLFEFPAGKIVKVEPSPGSEVLITETIKIYVSSEEQGAFLMPRLVGLRLDEALDKAETMRLQIEEILEQPSEAESGIVIIQHPEEGQKITSNVRIRLVVSRKSK